MLLISCIILIVSLFLLLLVILAFGVRFDDADVDLEQWAVAQAPKLAIFILWNGESLDECNPVQD